MPTSSFRTFNSPGGQMVHGVGYVYDTTSGLFRPAYTSDFGVDSLNISGIYVNTDELEGLSRTGNAYLASISGKINTVVPISGIVSITDSISNVAIHQNVTAPASMTTVADINAGDTWNSGVSGISTLGVAGIQVNVKMSQNGTVYVNQGSTSGAFQITDSYNYYSSLGGNSWTVQATSSYFRTRVKNLGSATATGVDISTALCPIVEALPRSLDSAGNMKVGIKGLSSNGFQKDVLVSPMRALKTFAATRLIGSNFNGNILDPNYWIGSLGTGGTITVADSQATVSTGSTANNTTSFASNRRARYVGAASNYYRAIVVLPTVTTASAGHANTRQWGAFDASDGFYFEAVQTNPATTPTLQLRSRKDAVDATAVTIFNGDAGSSYTLDTNVHTYEIYWTNSGAWFFIDDVFIHKMSALTAPLVGTQNLRISASSINSGGNDADNSIVVRVCTISRMGGLLTQPNSLYQSGITGGVVAKYGPGNLHKALIGSQANGAVVTIADGTTGAGAVNLFSFTYAQGAQANNQPFTLDFGGIPFYSGLYLTIATAAANVMLAYE